MLAQKNMYLTTRKKGDKALKPLVGNQGMWKQLSTLILKCIMYKKT